MKNKFINETIKMTFLLVLVGTLITFFLYNLKDSISIIMGALWGMTNLFLLDKLLSEVLMDDQKNYIKIGLLLGIKFPLLYFIGFLLLTTNYLSFLPVLFGSTLIFIGMIINGLRISFGTTMLIALLFSSPIFASLDVDVPEVPNFISLLYKMYQDSPFLAFLHHWETLFFSLASAIGISLLFYLGTKNATMIPTSKLQNFLEWIVESLRNFVYEVIGPQGEKYIPLLGTLFIYILVMNWLVLIPFMKAPTSNFNITVALAICVFCLVQYLNIKNYGFFGFIYHMAGEPKTALGWMLVPLMLPIELLTQFTRPITLALRLFGNVVGEDILIGAFAMFGVSLLEPYLAPLGLPLQIPFMFLALLTSLMQALVFTLLSAIYILLSMPSHEGKDLH